MNLELLERIRKAAEGRSAKNRIVFSADTAEADLIRQWQGRNSLRDIVTFDAQKNEIRIRISDERKLAQAIRDTIEQLIPDYGSAATVVRNQVHPIISAQIVELKKRAVSAIASGQLTEDLQDSYGAILRLWRDAVLDKQHINILLARDAARDLYIISRERHGHNHVVTQWLNGQRGSLSFGLVRDAGRAL